MRSKVLLCWSSGKDSAWALHELRRDGNLEVVGLVTTVNAKRARVAMHAVRLELLERQAAALGLPLHTVFIPEPCSNEAYDAAMAALMGEAKRDGIAAMAFGDLFLEDVRTYREERLEASGIEPLFPLWGRPTEALAHEMIASGLRATITCIDPKVLAPAFAGREFDRGFLADLPGSVDPCGERGEFHSFCHDGPMFERPVPVEAGEIVERDGFVFADLIPAGGDVPREAISRKGA